MDLLQKELSWEGGLLNQEIYSTIDVTVSHYHPKFGPIFLKSVPHLSLFSSSVQTQILQDSISSRNNAVVLFQFSKTSKKIPILCIKFSKIDHKARGGMLRYAFVIFLPSIINLHLFIIPQLTQIIINNLEEDLSITSIKEIVEKFLIESEIQSLSLKG